MSKFQKSGGRGKQKNQEKKPTNYNVGSKGKETLDKINENCPTIQSFRAYAKELDKKHDKFERIVKLGRDITIESKRIIFLLHSIDRESKKASVLSEAEKRLENLVSENWKAVAKELENEDPYLYHKAFSPGMQEFIEAFAFFNYLKNNEFPHWEKYQKQLCYEIPKKPEGTESDGVSCEILTTLVPADFILGLADVTGELMRKCINNLGEGDVEGCFSTCDIVRFIYSGFLTIGMFGNREMSRKLFTLRQSLLKMEMVCYNIHVRGTEVPKHMLADVDSQNIFAENDEGFFD